MTYQLLTNLDGTTSLVRTNADGSQTFIPQDLANSDYVEYLKTPVAVTPLTTEQQAEIAAQQAQATAQAASTTNLTTLIASMSAQVAQGKADLTTLGSSTDALAPILARAIEGILGLTQGLRDTLIVLNAVEASQIPAV